MAAREFLGERGVGFESLNAADGAEGERRWIESGRPTLPALAVDGRTIPVLHVSQVADALGLPAPPAASPRRDAEDAAAILDAWTCHVGSADWETLLRPTRSRGRSARNLTVNVFHPFELLPGAWRTGGFDWRPEDDAAREALLTDRGELVRFAEAAAGGWRSLLAHEDVGSRDPAIESPRGRVSFSSLVAFQRWHAAYHYRQLVAGVGVHASIDLDRFDDLVLPREVF